MSPDFLLAALQSARDAGTDTPSANGGFDLTHFLLVNGATFALNALAALAILIIGLIAASWIKRLTRTAIERVRPDDAMLASFLSSMVYYLAIAMVIIMVLGKFNVPVASLAAILGAAGLAIGLALQGTLGHLASGIMLLAFRPFRIGHYVEAGGEEGTIKDITLFTTVMATVDNKKVIIPNGKIWADTITNFSANRTRRLDMTFGISYDSSIRAARDILLKLAEEDARVMKDPAPLVEVDALGDWSVDFTVRLWLDGGDYFPVKWDMNRKVKEAFDAADISIPFPTAIEYQAEMAKPSEPSAQSQA